MSVTNSHINSEFRDIAITEASGNVIGIDVQRLEVADISGITLPGGLNGQQLLTDGAGSLYWDSLIPGIPNTAEQGNSNVIVSPNSAISLSSDGTANIMVISTTGVTLTNNVDFDVPANVKISGATDAGMAIVGTDSGTGIQFEQQLVIPQSGYGYGRLIARGGKIFRAGFGGLDNYVLGWGTATGTDVSMEILIDPGTSTQPKSWQKIHTNMSCIYALADTGVLYCSGANSNGQQGRGSSGDNATSILRANEYPTIYGPGITVLNFWSYEAAQTDEPDTGACMVTVNDNGTLKTFTFGYNEGGVLGTNTGTTPNYVPTQVHQFNGRIPISVSFHTNICMVVLDDGSLWGAGNNSYGGALGINSTSPINPTFVRAQRVIPSNPTAFTYFLDAVEVTIGFSFSGTGPFIRKTSAWVRRSNGEVWACGWNNADGQLGLGTNGGVNQNILRFRQCQAGTSGTPLANAVKIRSGFIHCAVLDSSNRLWQAGSNWNGWWGNGANITDDYPYFVNTQSSVDDFYVTQRDRDSLAIFITKNNQTSAAGLITNYQLGTLVTTAPSDYLRTLSPVYFGQSGEYATNIVTIGSVTNGVVSSSGSLFACGTLFVTNYNRAYVCGAMANVGSWGGSLLSPFPVEITDI